jgi:hypothetical protein
MNIYLIYNVLWKICLVLFFIFSGLVFLDLQKIIYRKLSHEDIYRGMLFKVICSIIFLSLYCILIYFRFQILYS